MERLVRIALAGRAAERRFDRRSPFRTHSDYKQAVDLITHFTGSQRHLKAYLCLLEVEAEEFLNLRRRASHRRPGLVVDVGTRLTEWDSR
jgi:hypothetical protein